VKEEWVIMAANRFLLRKEYFGGLIYDRLTRRETLLDKEEHCLLESIGDRDLGSMSLTTKQRDFVEGLRANGIVSANGFEADRVEVPVIRDGVLSAPIRLYYHITFGCNLTCQHCMFGNRKRDPDELTTKEALDVLRQLQEIGSPELRLTGGEPTVRPDLFEIIQDGVQRNMNVVVNTNGVFGDDIRRKFVTSGVGGLVISVDGDRETHDRIRGRESFDVTMDTICYLAEYNGTAVRQITVCLNPTISRENWHLAEFLVRRAVELGGAKLGIEINFMPLRPFGKGRNLIPKMLDPKEWLSFTKEIARLRNDPTVRETGLRIYSMNMDIFGCYPDCTDRPVPFDRSSCGAATFRMGLGPDGGGNICGFIGAEAEFKTPTTREASVLDIWHSEAFEKFRHVVKEPCELCGFYRKECVGVCKAMSYIATGDFGKYDHYCFAHLLGKAGLQSRTVERPGT